MDKTNILFLLSHQPNPRFIKQIKYLSCNNNISVIYYNRNQLKNLSIEYDKYCIINKSLGTIPNGNYIKRIYIYLKSVYEFYFILEQNRYDKLIVNNIDTLLLYMLCKLFNKNVDICIEISDLRSHTYTNNMKSYIMKKIEKLTFHFVDKLIVTSPKFYAIYYKNFFYKDVFVLKNKPLSNLIPIKLKKTKNEKLVIGIVGLLLQGKPYQTLFEIIKNNIQYEVHIYGKGLYQTLVEEYSKKYNNIIYFGEYNFFQDSAKIYSSIDLLYMPYDTTNGSLNNKIALPNKLYEAMYFQVPIITSTETYLGDIVEKREIGKTVRCCDKEELYSLLESINVEDFKDKFNRLDQNLYLGDNDYLELEKFING